MRAVRDAGHEVGVHTYDHVRWQDGVSRQDAAWTRQEMERARASFRQVFGFDPTIHGAAGWQMNAHAFRLTAELGFDISSDTRGVCPFLPVQDGQPIGCPQLPTTLPTLDEMVGVDGVTEQNVARHLLERTHTVPRQGHVFTLHAELEGLRWAPILETLLIGWRAQNYTLVPLGEYFRWLPNRDLPKHLVHARDIPGRSGTVMVQGPRIGD
jgi:peptidoglycan/xylan/chitin deacetylase (PgdA/CDA1 family)